MATEQIRVTKMSEEERQIISLLTPQERLTALHQAGKRKLETMNRRITMIKQSIFISGLIADERRLGDLISSQVPWANDETSVYREVDGYTVINDEYEGQGIALGPLGQWFT